MDIEWKAVGVMLTLLGMVIGAVWGYAKLNGKVDNHDKDIQKNDERLRKELNDQSDQYDKRFEDIEHDVNKLMENRSHHDKRLTQIEEQTKHTAKTMDVLVVDVKEIMKQLTSVATTIATKNNGG